MKSYKNKALNPEEMRRRREEEGIQLRKQKREQQVTVTLSRLCSTLTQPRLCCCLTGIFKDLCIKVCWQSLFFFFSVLTEFLLFSFFSGPSSRGELSKHFVLGLLEGFFGGLLEVFFGFVHRSLVLNVVVFFGGVFFRCN